MYASIKEVLFSEGERFTKEGKNMAFSKDSRQQEKRCKKA